MVDYWETVRGLKKGTKPNPAKLLYGAYVRWAKSQGEVPVTMGKFTDYLTGRGYTKAQHRARRQCWYLNKYIVPKTSLA